MNKARQLALAGAAIVSLVWATPAMAVTSTRVVITQDQQEVPETRIQLFDADTGAEVRREDDDGSGALFLLDGGRYRVVVDGETVREISVTGSGSETFEIGLPPSGQTAQPGDDDGFLPGGGFIAPRFGYGGADVPSTGIGFRRDGAAGEAPETFAVTTDGNIPMYSGGVAIGLSGFFLDLFYGEGDAQDEFQIPNESGVDSGVVYGDLSPSGSSGIATPFGLTGWASIDVAEYGIRGKIPLGFGHPKDVFRPFAYGGYTRYERDYIGFADYTGTSGEFTFEFSQDRRQELNESYFDLGLGGKIMAPLGPAVLIHLGARAGGYYRDTGLSSVERNTCNFCPAEDEDFTIQIDESDSGFGFAGGANAALELRLSRSVSLMARGSADYRSKVGAVWNPNSGDQVFFDGLSTELATEDAWSWQAGGGILIRFAE
jgi:hypothetical protein